MGEAFFNVVQTLRGSSRFEMVVLKIFTGKTVEAYMSICSRDRNRTSISMYLGQHICLLGIHVYGKFENSRINNF